jgi:uncharacterized protein YdeI (YjbR/CyaY-like superfamily)
MENLLTFNNRTAWREWLAAHHQSERVAWLVYFKVSSGVASIDYEASVEEALCFGWIDSIIKKIDEQRYARKFTPRTNREKWSETNRRRVRKLAAEGRMTLAGLALVNFPLEAPQDEVPLPSRPIYEFSPEILAVFQANVAAWAFFNHLSPSERRNVTGWIMSGKKDETRLRRLEEAMTVFAEGRHLGLK